MNSLIVKALFVIWIAAASLLAGAARPLSDAEILTKAYSHGSEIVMLGRMAEGKLQDMQLREYNERMKQDHRIALESIDKLEETFELELKPKSLDQEGFASKSGKAFGKLYTEKTVSYHESLLVLLTDRLIPAANSAQVKAILQNYEERVETLLRNAKKLSNLLDHPQASE